MLNDQSCIDKEDNGVVESCTAHPEILCHVTVFNPLNVILPQFIHTNHIFGIMIINCLMDICKDTAKIALSQASVLISGESGTGKELIARAIHYNSRRAKEMCIRDRCCWALALSG